MTLNIKEYIGEYCVNKDQGNKLYNFLKSRIDKAIIVKLNFRNVRVITTSFLYSAIGKLFKDYTRETIATLVKYQNISNFMSYFESVIENSQKYYSNEVFRDNVSQSIGCDLEKIKIKNDKKGKKTDATSIKISPKKEGSEEEKPRFNGIPIHSIQ